MFYYYRSFPVTYQPDPLTEQIASIIMLMLIVFGTGLIYSIATDKDKQIKIWFYLTGGTAALFLLAYVIINLIKQFNL